MKRIRIYLALSIAIFALFGSACATEQSVEETVYLRFHIRANSNTEQDQSVKLLCRDAVVTYLEGELTAGMEFETARGELKKRLTQIEALCDKVLNNEGFSYRASARITNEFFPTRAYEEVVLDSGYYDALIIGLGVAEGDNWWCVIYPPLCYLEAKESGSVFYKSKIAEIIRNWSK